MRSSKHNIFHLIKLSFHLIKLINIILSTIFFRFSVLHYASRKRKVNDNRTLAIKFRTGENKTFSEFYRYLFDSFGFIESWVVQSDRKKGVALGIHRAAITAPAYLRLGSPRLALIYIRLLSIARWVKVGVESRLIKRHPAAALFIDCVGDRLAFLRSRLSSFLQHSLMWSSSYVARKDRGKIDEQHRGNISIMETITILKFVILEYFHGMFVHGKLARLDKGKR